MQEDYYFFSFLDVFHTAMTQGGEMRCISTQRPEDQAVAEEGHGLIVQGSFMKVLSESGVF